MQEIANTGPVETQINVGNVEGDIVLKKKSRFSTRFEKLNNEVAADSRYEGVMEELKYYLTKLDGVDMPTKLRDGGFRENEITEASRKKEKYAKRLEKNKFYESAQWIDSQLFAKIKMDFEAYVDPLIKLGEPKSVIFQKIVEYVVSPVLALINDEGELDEVLNYSAEDILGMVYYLTGQCHLNWKDYDSI